MKRVCRFKKIISLLLVICLLPIVIVSGEESLGTVESRRVTDKKYGSYTLTAVTGLTPYVFMPTGVTSECEEDYMSVAAMMETYGEQNRFVCAVNAGIFYASEEGRWYGFNHKEADGPVICNGIVLKSAESVDHTECTLLVIDESGNIGYAPFDSDADALAAGTGTWYDIHGEPVTGQKIVSAVTGFVPIVINGKHVYDKSDKQLHGYMNYVGHYTGSATRQILGVKEDGTVIFLTDDDGWTLAEAANVAIKQGCVFAYNLDGGRSAQTVLGEESENGYTTKVTVGKGLEARTVPTYIVFTADNCAPISADPIGWDVEITGVPETYTEKSLAENLSVKVTYLNANGKLSFRTLITSSAAESGSIEHETWGGSSEYKKCRVLHKSVTKGGVLICEMSPTEKEGCINVNRNVRKDGKYYDYSSGYSLLMEEDGLSLQYNTGDMTLSAYIPFSEFKEYQLSPSEAASENAMG